MSWTRLSITDDPGVLVTVSKKIVTLILCQQALYALGWGASWKVAIELGDGEHAGWVRIVNDERGIGSEASPGRLALSVPRSTLPDLTEARLAPLVWRVTVDSALEVRLPTVAAGARPKTALRSVSDAPVGPHAVAVPERYSSLHQDAWIAGVELVFLSDETCAVNGKIVAVGEVEATVRPLIVAA